MPKTRVPNGVKTIQYQTRALPEILLARARVLAAMRPARWQTIEEVFNEALQAGLNALVADEGLKLPPASLFEGRPPRPSARPTPAGRR